MRILPLLLLLVAACSTSSAAPSPVEDELAKPNRALTAGEIALLKPIFRDGIDYAKVRVINNSFPLQPANVYMTPRGHVYAPGGLWSADFSRASSGTRGVFIHEMTHVWQFANGMDLVGQGFVEFTRYRGQYEKAYPYELERSRDLTEYGMEQQASIVEDYFAIKYAHEHPHRITNRGITDGERDALYAAVLKKFLGNPRYAQTLDGKQVAEQHAKASEKKKPGPEACKESEEEHGATHLCEWRYTPKKKP
ncbi:MAG: hypothetical protein ABI867_11900 [Kofleriaceae bacterium]